MTDMNQKQQALVTNNEQIKAELGFGGGIWGQGRSSGQDREH